MVARDRLILPVFVIASILAGGNAVGVRFSNRELDPLWGAGLRFGLAAVLLFVLVAVRRAPLPRGRGLLGAVLYGLLSFAGAFSLAYYGLQRIHAGLGQTVLALVPLATLLLAVAQRQERMRVASALGALIALAGIVVISGGEVGRGVPVLSLLAVIGSVLCFAEAAVLVRRFPAIDPVALNAVAMAAGTAVLVAGSVLLGERLALPREPTTWVALAYLVPVGSVVVFVSYLLVIRAWGATRAAYSFVIIPVVTVLVSAWLDAEPVGLSLLLGGILVLAGVYVGALHPAAEASPPPGSPAEQGASDQAAAGS